MRGGGAPKSLTEEGSRALVKNLLCHCGSVFKRHKENDNNNIEDIILRKNKHLLHLGYVLPRKVVSEAKNLTAMNKNVRDNYRKCAFTLAEVLITLGIIGVVAALTMPVIQENVEKQVAISRLKKVYSMLAQGIKASEAVNGPISDWPSGRDITDVMEYYNQYWKPYYRNPHMCITAVTCGYSSLHPWTNMNGDVTGWSVQLANSRTLFMLQDGTLIFNPRNSFSNGSEAYVNLFYVDINGSKKPNIVGKDVFIFTIADGKVLRPYGYNYTVAQIDANCTKNSRGNYNSCTAKIIKDGWQMKGDYPW